MQSSWPFMVFVTAQPKGLERRRRFEGENLREWVFLRDQEKNQTPSKKMPCASPLWLVSGGFAGIQWVLGGFS